MRMTESLVTCKEKVGHILNAYPETRDSDKTLWLAYLVIFHNLKNTLGEENYRVFKAIIMNDKTPTMESIRRIRQKFQEDGKYVGENRIDRLKESESVRDLMNHT
jgi:hypothetical protein